MAIEAVKAYRQKPFFVSKHGAFVSQDKGAVLFAMIPNK